jgi:glycosyltransferase involved in cell wall biosynthesis
MESPLVSIIIPVYNAEAYLSQCLDSVLHQAYQHIEVILINDGSTDRSSDICREYAKNDKRIILFEQENQGVSAARNAALTLVHGEYITFLDSDDFFTPDALEIMTSAIISNQADICSFGMIIDSGIRRVPYNCFDETTVLNKKETIFRYISSKDITATLCGRIYRAPLFHGIVFPVGHIYEDAYMLPELFHRADRCVFIKDNLYIQNMSIGSITRSNFSLKNLDIILCEENRMRFISTNYPEWFDYVVYSRCSAIASVLAKILRSRSYAQYRELYESLSEELEQEYKRVFPQSTENSRIHDYVTLAIRHPRLFKFKVYNSEIIQQTQKRIKFFMQKTRR